MTQIPVQPSYSQSKTQLRPPKSLALKLKMTIKTATYALIILRNKNIMWEIASIHQLTSHPRVKISNQSKNVLFDVSVLMARELSKAYFLSLLMMIILHITYIVINFEIDICFVRLLDLCLPRASH